MTSVQYVWTFFKAIIVQIFVNIIVKQIWAVGSIVHDKFVWNFALGLSTLTITIFVFVIDELFTTDFEAMLATAKLFLIGQLLYTWEIILEHLEDNDTIKFFVSLLPTRTKNINSQMAMDVAPTKANTVIPSIANLRELLWVLMICW